MSSNYVLFRAPTSLLVEALAVLDRRSNRNRGSARFGSLFRLFVPSPGWQVLGFAFMISASVVPPSAGSVQVFPLQELLQPVSRAAQFALLRLFTTPWNGSFVLSNGTENTLGEDSTILISERELGQRQPSESPLIHERIMVSTILNLVRAFRAWG